MITHMTPTDLPYQKIDTLSSKEPELARNSSASSQNVKEKSNLRQFYCQFDPKHRSGRSLVLKFDIFGNSYFEEMSRIDVLRMTEEAAKEREQDNECIHVVPMATSVSPRAGSKTFPRPQRSSNADRMDNALHGGICDVQRVHARDIRKLNNVYAVSNEPSIVLRKQAILVNADPIRALVMRDACLVFVPDGADSLLSLLKEKFHESNQDMTTQAFELRALEALLATLCRIFESDYEKMAPVVISALDRLANGKIGTNELDTLRTYKNTINEFESQVDGVRRALMEILDNEEDLRLLYLTKLHKNPSLLTDLWSFDSEEVEAMIENYLQDIYTTRTKANLMQHRIQNTESLVMMKLDYSRNYLLGVELLFSLVALGVSIGTYVTGIFGMNLASGIPEQPVYFYGTVVITGIAIIVIVVAGVFFFRRQGVYL
ncbi:unnamed protein product [Albugo candida]|nr:unnamed protein product [Albugo candida]|eukprot:CCI39788.1 unnamed protein product [Albugo candida]